MMAEVRLRVNENGRVVLPAAFPKAHNIRAGDLVLARLDRDEVRIPTLKHRLEQAQHHVRQFVKPGRSSAKELIAERREAAKHELHRVGCLGALGLTLKAPVYTTERGWKSLKLGVRIHVIR